MTRFQAQTLPSHFPIVLFAVQNLDVQKKLPEIMAKKMAERQRNPSAGNNHGLILDPSNPRHFESNFNSLSTSSACDISRSRSWNQKMDETNWLTFAEAGI